MSSLVTLNITLLPFLSLSLSLSLFFQLPGIVVVTGSSTENRVKKLSVTPEAVRLLSQFTSYPWKLQCLSQAFSHIFPGEDRLRQIVLTYQLHYLPASDTDVDPLKSMLICQIGKHT